MRNWLLEARTEILKLTKLGFLNEVLENTIASFELKQLLQEDVFEALKPPSWVKGYEGLWWAAVSRLYQDGKHMKGNKGNFAGVSMIFKAYLKRLTGYNVDQIKELNKTEGPRGGEHFPKSGDVVKDAKSDMAKGMGSGSGSAARQMGLLSALNKSLSQLMTIKDEKEFMDAVKERIYQKYLKK